MRFKKPIAAAIAVLVIIAAIPVFALASGWRDVTRESKQLGKLEKVWKQIEAAEAKAISEGRPKNDIVRAVYQEALNTANVDKSSFHDFSEDGFFFSVDGMLCSYNYRLRNELESDGSTPIPDSEKLVVVKGNPLNASVSTRVGNAPRSKDVLLVGPFYGHDVGFNLCNYRKVAQSIANTLGGNLTMLTSTAATGPAIASHIKNKGVVIFNTHGVQCLGTTYIALTTTAGLTSEDYSDWSASYNGSNGYIDGRYIKKHMDGSKLSNCFIHIAACQGMKKEGSGVTGKALIEAGAAAVLGYTQNVSFLGLTTSGTTFWNAMMSGESVAEAFRTMTRKHGNTIPVSPKKPYPIIMSPVDPYPENPDSPQTVNCNWSLTGKYEEPASPVNITLVNRFFGMDNDIEWANNTNKYFPKNISYQLYANGQPYGEAQTFNNAFSGNSWDDQAKWTGVPKKDANGNEIDYSVRIVSNDERWITTSNTLTKLSDTDYRFDIAQRWAMAAFSVENTWTDPDRNQTNAPAGANITVKLMRSSDNQQIATLRLNAENNFTGTFTTANYTNNGEQDAFIPRIFSKDANGNVIFQSGKPVMDESAYYLVEEGHNPYWWTPEIPSNICASQYYLTSNNGRFHIRFNNCAVDHSQSEPTTAPVPTQVYMNFSVLNSFTGMDNDIEWANDRKYSMSGIAYQLMANGRAYGDVKRLTNQFTSNDRSWDDQAQWTNVPKYDESGNEINYTLKVASLDERWLLTDNELKPVSSNDFRFELRHRWAMARINVSLAWQDINRNSVNAPNGALLKVDLMKRGNEKKDELIASAYLTDENGFSGTFKTARYTNDGSLDAFLPRVFRRNANGEIVCQDGKPVLDGNAYYLIENWLNPDWWTAEYPSEVLSVRHYSGNNNGEFNLRIINHAVAR